MEANQVLLIIACATPHIEAQLYFDKLGNFIEDEHYLLFERFGEPVMEQVVEGLPQLVMTSHTGDLDATIVARSVKAKNPEAMVVAFTSSRISKSECKHIDGVLNKTLMERQHPAEVVNKFRSGASREEVIALLERFAR